MTFSEKNMIFGERCFSNFFRGKHCDENEFLSQIIIYQRFYGMLLMLSFYFKAKICVSALVCKGFVLKTLSKKLYLQFYKSFIQMVKYSFPDERIVYRSFLNISIISKRLLPS